MAEGEEGLQRGVWRGPLYNIGWHPACTPEGLGYNVCCQPVRCMTWMKWIVCTLTEVSVGEEIPLSLILFTPSEGVMKLWVPSVLDTPA